MTVERVRVGDVLELDRVPIEPQATERYVAIGVRSFGKGIFHYEEKPGDQLGKSRFFELKPRRLVVSNIKGWEGAVAVSAAADDGCIASNRFLAYRPVDDRIDVDWARWLFLSDAGLPLIQQASPGSADRNRTLAIERFEDLRIPLPPIEVQQMTAARLGVLRGHLDHLGSRLDDGVARMKPALPALIDEILVRLAVGSARVGDLVEFISDTVHPGDDPGPADRFVGLQHIEGHTGRGLGSDALVGLKGRKFRFRPGDIVYGYLRPYLNKVWIADGHGLCSVDQYVLRPREGVNAELLWFALRGQGVLDAAIELTHSLQLPRLRSGLLAGIEVPNIPEHLVDEVLARLHRCAQRVVEIDARRERQISLAAAVLPAALNAEFGAYQ